MLSPRKRTRLAPGSIGVAPRLTHVVPSYATQQRTSSRNETRWFMRMTLPNDPSSTNSKFRSRALTPGTLAPNPFCMIAAVLKDFDRLELDEIPTPVPGPGQVLVKIRACGFCATDYKAIKGIRRNVSFPLVPGHEPAGVVTATDRKSV